MTIRLTAVTCVLLAACLPRPLPPPPRPPLVYITEFVASPPVVSGDAMWMSVVRSQGQHDSRVYLVRCPIDGTLCAWREAVVTDAMEDARRAAALQHDCAFEEVSVAAEHAAGVWLDVCATQRFYRREADGWVEQAAE